MVFKSVGYGGASDRVYTPPVQRRVEAPLVALVGSPQKRKPSNNRVDEVIERVSRINNDVLGYNLDGRMCLMRSGKNDRNFDEYLSLPFTKGVTERVTGRTLLILGSNSHHGEAMAGQFSGVLWTPDLLEEIKRYGDTIRWINVGDVKSGFIGLDYEGSAQRHDGVATSLEDVKFLANSLIEFGYDPGKRLFLLKPPYIVESERGKDLRKRGYDKLGDYAKVGK